jgi:hypothetical protein
VVGGSVGNLIVTIWYLDVAFGMAGSLDNVDACGLVGISRVVNSTGHGLFVLDSNAGRWPCWLLDTLEKGCDHYTDVNRVIRLPGRFYEERAHLVHWLYGSTGHYW